MRERNEAVVAPSSAPDPAAVVPVLARADHSRYVQRIRRRYAAEIELFNEIDPGVPLAPAVRLLINRLREEGRPLPSALRVARQLVLEWLVVLDVEQYGMLGDITAAMTQLAEVTLDLALKEALAEHDAKHGASLDEQGRRIDLWVVGMGKLGGRELNVSSDIDLV